MGLLNSPRLSLGLKANGQVTCFSCTSWSSHCPWLILSTGAFNYNDSNKYLHLHRWSLVVIQSLLNISTWLSSGTTNSMGTKHALMIFSPSRFDYSLALVPVKSTVILPVSFSSGTLLTPPFSSPSQRFLLAMSSLFCHLNSKCTSKYPNTAHEAVHNFGCCLPGLFHFLSSFPFEFFVLAILNLERPSHTLLSLGLHINLTKVACKSLPHFSL